VISTLEWIDHELVIVVAALLAPIVADAIPRVRVPVVVVEIILGILIGPQILDLADSDAVTQAFSNFGLAFLFFLAGFEIDIDRISGRPLRLALTGWVESIAAAFALAGVLVATGLVSSWLHVALAMSTTAIGTLLPILRDAGESETRLGTFVLAAGAVGEFGPIIMIALLLNNERGTLTTALVLELFVLIVLVGVLLARRWRPERLSRLVRQTMHTSAQLAVRVSIALLLAFVFLAEEFELDFLLGAFASGVIVAQIVKSAGPSAREDIEALTIKYEGIGFGFFIPIFFVVTGVTFDLDALLGSATSLALLPVFLVFFLVVRGGPVMLLYRDDLDAMERSMLALFAATQLPLVVAITNIGVASGDLASETAAAMVGAAMLSVLIFPLLALSRRRDVATAETPALMPADTGMR
jgi:Kef-type K+ transport system membrane component KefB